MPFMKRARSGGVPGSMQVDEAAFRMEALDLSAKELQSMQTGSYALQPQGRQTQVTYTLAVDLTVPLLALFKRRAEQAIMDAALTSLKKRVEGRP